MKFLAGVLPLVLILLGCSPGVTTRYADGDPASLTFSTILSIEKSRSSHHYRVTRDAQKRIVKVREFAPDRTLLARYEFKYGRRGDLLEKDRRIFYDHGPEQVVSKWTYETGQTETREDVWYTRDRSFEKRITTYFDSRQRPYLEETEQSGFKTLSSTEFYYDYAGHLDKSQRNFFLPDGTLRDYWITVYDDREVILREEHYLPDNTLLAFYRYTYQPSAGWLETEEYLDDNQNLFIRRDFRQDGAILREQRFNRSMELQEMVRYEYDDRGQPKRALRIAPDGTTLGTQPYGALIVQGGYRSP